MYYLGRLVCFETFKGTATLFDPRDSFILIYEREEYETKRVVVTSYHL